MRTDAGDAVFISWIAHHGRSAALAGELRADPLFIAVGRTGDRRTAPIRHALQALATVVVLLRRRPRRVYVMAPPTLLTAIVTAYAWLARARVGIDAHTGAVLGDGAGGPSKAMRRLMAGARVTLVTSEHLAAVVRRVGGTPVVVHNPPPAHEPDTTGAAGQVGVLVPCGWAPDEPLVAVVEAAALVPEVLFTLTGTPRRGVLDRDALPANVRLAGQLDGAEYERALAGAEVVLALTTRPLTMQQAAYEAMAHARPLVVSDSGVLRDYFGDAAVFTGPDPDPQAIASAVVEARSRSMGLTLRMRQLAAVRRGEFEDAKASVLRAMA